MSRLETADEVLAFLNAGATHAEDGFNMIEFWDQLGVSEEGIAAAALSGAYAFDVPPGIILAALTMGARLALRASPMEVH